MGWLDEHGTGEACRDILHPGSRNLFRYWENIRGERSAPLRSDMELREIHHLLPWVFIIESAGPAGSHLARLAGTGICQLWGENVTGRDLFASWQRFERETMTRLLEGTIGRHQPFAMRLRASTAQGRSLGLEILGLPIHAHDDAGSQVLGMIVPFLQPEWLGLDRLSRFELSSVRVFLTGDDAAVPSPRRPRSLTRRSPAALEVIPGGKLPNP